MTENNSGKTIIVKKRKASKADIYLPLFILIATILISSNVFQDLRKQKDIVSKGILLENKLKIESTRGHVNEYFSNMYTSLFFMSLNPDIEAMNDKSYEYIKTLYNLKIIKLKNIFEEIHLIGTDFKFKNGPLISLSCLDVTISETKDHTMFKDEEEEYKALEEQLKNYIANYELKAQISREIKLCLRNPDGIQMPGVVFSVPVFSENKVAGIIATMISTKKIQEILELGNYANTVVLVSEMGDIFGCEDLPTETKAWFKNQFSEKIPSKFFAEAPESFKIGNMVSLWSPVNIVGQPWWIIFQFNNNVYLKNAGIAHGLYGFGSAAVILSAGIILAFFIRIIFKRFEDRISFLNQRQEIVEELKRAKDSLTNILESSLDCIVVTDDKGNIIMANKGFVQLVGYNQAELCERRMSSFIPGKQGSYNTASGAAVTIDETFINNSKKAQKTIAAEGMIFLRESFFIRKDGKIVPVEENISLLENETGAVSGTVWSLRDITERKKMEYSLAQAQKMEVIGLLAGGVAHDLNNILGAIVGYPDLLLDDMPEDSPMRSSIIAIKKSGERAAAIVQDLLTLTRRGVNITETINLNSIINEYIGSSEHKKLKEFHPNVEFNVILETKLLNVIGSPIHLSKVIMNLVSNAAESITHGGKVLISSENKYLDKSLTSYDTIKEGEYVVLSVSDNGMGISKEDAVKIFDPFYTKKAMGRSGTGLGMTVVLGTVKDHKGYIDMESTEGKGTTFRIYFPVSREEIHKSNNKEEFLPTKEYSGNGEKILIVDDIDVQRDIALSILKRLNYNVDAVSSGEEAIEYMKINSADLLVIDMIMDPGMDGLETYKRILEIHPGQKAIIASGFSETSRVKEALKLGVGQYIRKPYTIEQIGLVVKDELKKRS